MVLFLEFILSVLFFSPLLCYSLIKALTASTMLFHHFPSSSLVQPLIPSICVSGSTFSNHLIRGLPLFCVHSGSINVIFLLYFVCSYLKRCSEHVTLTRFTTFYCFWYLTYDQIVSRLTLFLHNNNMYLLIDVPFRVVLLWPCALNPVTVASYEAL